MAEKWPDIVWLPQLQKTKKPSTVLTRFWKFPNSSVYSAHSGHQPVRGHSLPKGWWVCLAHLGMDFPREVRTRLRLAPPNALSTEWSMGLPEACGLVPKAGEGVPGFLWVPLTVGLNFCPSLSVPQGTPPSDTICPTLGPRPDKAGLAGSAVPPRVVSYGCGGQNYQSGWSFSCSSWVLAGSRAGLVSAV